MLYDAAEDPATLTPTALREAYETRLREVVTDRGIDTVAAESGVDVDDLEALVEGPVPDFSVTDAAAVLALDDERDAETIVLELRDHLLLAMTTGVVDVDTLASNVDLDRSGQELQQAIEGRSEMTLEVLAAIRQFLAARNDR
ncbi:DUF5791 family protein [Halobellus marinus]|jgi:hypothetical protein|uniref:DUF5791 family protein n=1 Tax=Halobellus TaxID=1073986 RepID=UPI0028A9346B|nr:DUF5791 family protein [Halobellus sp. DFY28]